MIKMVLYLRMVDLASQKVPGTFSEKNVKFFPKSTRVNSAQCTFSLNSLKNLPISDARLSVPTENLSLKGVEAGLRNQKRESNA